jgi:hypothetical protein
MIWRRIGFVSSSGSCASYSLRSGAFSSATAQANASFSCSIVSGGVSRYRLSAPAVRSTTLSRARLLAVRAADTPAAACARSCSSSMPGKGLSPRSTPAVRAVALPGRSRDRTAANAGFATGTSSATSSPRSTRCSRPMRALRQRPAPVRGSRRCRRFAARLSSFVSISTIISRG